MITQSAVVMQLIRIGEQSRKLSDEYKASIDLPWKDIVGMRNMAAHDYENLRLRDLWDTIQISIPELKSKLR